MWWNGYEDMVSAKPIPKNEMLVVEWQDEPYVRKQQAVLARTVVNLLLQQLQQTGNEVRIKWGNQALRNCGGLSLLGGLKNWMKSYAARRRVRSRNWHPRSQKIRYILYIIYLASYSWLLCNCS